MSTETQQDENTDDDMDALGLDGSDDESLEVFDYAEAQRRLAQGLEVARKAWPQSQWLQQVPTSDPLVARRRHADEGGWQIAKVTPADARAVDWFAYDAPYDSEYPATNDDEATHSVGWALVALRQGRQVRTPRMQADHALRLDAAGKVRRISLAADMRGVAGLLMATIPEADVMAEDWEIA